MSSSGGRRVDGPIAGLAESQHGVVDRKQLCNLGFDQSAIESRIRRGALIAIHRGVYAVGHAQLTLHGRWTAAVLAAGPGAALSHRSAAQLWGLMPRSSIAPEVTRSRSFRPRPGINCHQSPLPTDEVEELEGIPVTSVSRTILDLATAVDRHRLERAMNEAEVRRLRSRLSLALLLDRYPRRPGSASLRALLREHSPAAGVTRNDFELRFRELVQAHGLPVPRFNADLAVGGRFFEVDCLWSDQRLIVELDGRAVHGTRHAFEADRERDRLLLVEGWRVARVTWRQLSDTPSAVAADLRGLLARAA